MKNIKESFLSHEMKDDTLGPMSTINNNAAVAFRVRFGWSLECFVVVGTLSFVCSHS